MISLLSASQAFALREPKPWHCGCVSVADLNVCVVAVRGCTSAQDAATTLAVFFEIVAQAKDAAAQNAMGDQGLQQFYVQFKANFLHPNGTSRVRVTTFTRRRAPPPGPPQSAAWLHWALSKIVVSVGSNTVGLVVLLASWWSTGSPRFVAHSSNCSMQARGVFALLIARMDMHILVFLGSWAPADVRQVGGRQQRGRAGRGLRPGGGRGGHRAAGHAQDGDRRGL